jgi:sterol 3beta-glucosyltransferase
MNVTILAVGTEGDVRPFIALALGLSREGHTVRLAANKNFADLVTKSGLAFVPLSGDYRALAAEAHSVLQVGLGVFTVPRFMRRALVPMAQHWAEEGSDACADADVIIGTGAADCLAASIAEALAKPCALAYLQPLVPSYNIPPVAFPPRRDAYIPFVNISFHYIFRLFLWHIVRPACNDVVRRSLGLHPYPWYGPQYFGGLIVGLRLSTVTAPMWCRPLSVGQIV